VTAHENPAAQPMNNGAPRRHNRRPTSPDTGRHSPSHPVQRNNPSNKSPARIIRVPVVQSTGQSRTM